MEKHTDRILWTVLILALGASLYVFGKPAFSNIVHASTQKIEDVLYPPKQVDSSSNSDFSYSEPDKNNGTISIVGYSGHNENLIIPQYRKIGSAYYKITAISDNAFNRNKSIKQVTIPDGVRTIGANAFGHTDLTRVDLPASLISIDICAFEYTHLTSVDLPAGLTSIGDSAFDSTALTRVDLPASLTSIGNYAFFGTNLTSVDFPASLNSIGVSAFRDTQISAISFRKRVDLGHKSFTDTKLTNVTLPTGSTYTTSSDPTFDSNVKVTIK